MSDADELRAWATRCAAVDAKNNAALLTRAAEAVEERERLRTELSAACGYMENARISLSTGTKASAAATLADALKRARAALEPRHD